MENSRGGATLEAGQDGQGALFRLRGELNFGAVPGLLASGRETFPAAGLVRLDLGGLTGVNSAGLALLLEWQREFQRGGRELKLINVPRALTSIARVSELESVLTL
ncbi:MAG: STAS domain-containing protein [Gammaproteobacteria bacterium]|nr:STAS domain-containing protein [Gammaproteobacteria bacterium]